MSTMFPQAKTAIEEIEYLGDDEYVVTWVWVDSLFPTTTQVTAEFEPADPSVGYMTSFFSACGDAPQDVLDAVAEEAMERVEARYEAAREFSYDD
jgi:hypothetical protein